jgi:hypothetical protein
MMYELIMLKPAFSGNNPLQMAKKIVTQEYERIPQEAASGKLRKIVQICMEKDPDKRPDIIGVPPVF